MFVPLIISSPINLSIYNFAYIPRKGCVLTLRYVACVCGPIAFVLLLKFSEDSASQISLRSEIRHMRVRLRR